MSVDATSWAWRQPVAKSTTKFVLLALADRAGADNCAYPSVETISRDTSLNRKTVLAALKWLVAEGFIEDTRQRKGATQKVVVYRLLGVNNRHAEASRPAWEKRSKRTENGTVTPADNVADKHAQKRNDSENGTVSSSSDSKPESCTDKQSQKRNSTENGTVPILDGNSPKNGTLNSPKNGTQNLSVEPISEPVVVVRGELVPDEPIDHHDNDNDERPSLFDLDVAPASDLNAHPFEMHFEWTPSARFYERCRLQGVMLNNLSADEQSASLGAFVSYHEGQGTRKTQGGFEHLLAGWVQRDIRQREAEQANATPQARRAAVTAEIMDISNTNWAD